MNDQILKIQNLWASYNSKSILQNINFSIERGQLVCICGPNGCGKSTLLSCIANIQSNSLTVSKDAKISLNSQELKNLKPKQLAQNIAYLQQSENCTWNFTVKDFVLQGRFCYRKNGFYSLEDRQAVDQVLQFLEIEKLCNCMIHEISGGEFQKVRIARALVQNPKFLLLDEPASNLDFTYEPKLMTLLKNICSTKNIGILMVIHDMNMAVRFADNLLLLTKTDFCKNEPQFIFGKTNQIFTQQNLEKIFNSPFTLYEHPVFKINQICQV